MLHQSKPGDRAPKTLQNIDPFGFISIFRRN
jgi:hypothetical protein